MNSVDQHKENLMRELNQVLKDAEDLIKNSEQQAGEGFQSAKDKLQATLKIAKKEIQHIEEVAIKKTKEAAHATDAYVHENPWKTAGIAAGVGLLVGMLIARNK
ncbi:MAG: YqjD family protein [Candidatus Aquirickettsiella gammari]